MSSVHPKNPKAPRDPLTLPPDSIYEWDKPLWRIHTLNGRHPSAWNELRWNGPIRSMRWDPQRGPLSARSDVGVTYVSPDYVTCFAEVVQAKRMITLTSDRALTSWRPSRPLQLLNLLGGSGTGDWAVQQGASASLPQAPKSTCRSWAASIFEQLGDKIDGLLVPSTVVGDESLVLFNRAETAFPSAPSFSRTLEHDSVGALAVQVQARLHWPIR